MIGLTELLKQAQIVLKQSAQTSEEADRKSLQLQYEDGDPAQGKQDKALAVVSASILRLNQNRGLIPHFVLRLTEEGQLTPDNKLLPNDINRKKFLRNLSIKIYVNINGKRVTSTGFSSFRQQSPIVDLKRYFEFRLVHQPSDVTLDIVCKRNDSLDQSERHLTSISIPFPGQQIGHRGSQSGGPTASKAKNFAALSQENAGPDSSGVASMRRSSSQQPVAHSYSPTAGWYEFATMKPLPEPFAFSDLFLFYQNDESQVPKTHFTQAILKYTPYPVRYK